MDFTYGKNRSEADNLTTSFQWDTVAGMFVSCDKPERKPEADTRRSEVIGKLRQERHVWSYSSLVNAIMSIRGCSKPAAEAFVRRTPELEKTSEGFYEVKG